MGLKVLCFLIATGLIAYYIYTPIPDAVEQKLKVMVVDACFRTLENVAGLMELLGLRHYMQVMMLLTHGEHMAEVSDENITVTDTVFNGVPVRVYVPARQTTELRRGIIFFHGGGWCVGSATMKPYDHLSRTTANTLNAVIISVNYRLAPEYHFPVQFEDSYTVVKYFLQDQILAQYSVDPDRIGVSGDSAGGNLAAAVAQQIQEDVEVKVQLKVQVLIYPALQTLDLDTPSYQQNKNMPILSKSLMVRFWSEYFATDKSLYQAMASNMHIPLESSHFFTFVNWSIYLPENFRKNYTYIGPKYGNAELLEKYPGILDSRAAPLLVEDTKLKALPKAYVITCEYDVLRDDGIMYASRLSKAGIHVTHDHFEDSFHGAFMFVVWPTDLEVGYRMLKKYLNWLDTNL